MARESWTQMTNGGDRTMWMGRNAAGDKMMRRSGGTWWNGSEGRPATEEEAEDARRMEEAGQGASYS